MMFPGDIMNNVQILVKRWFEYLFCLDSNDYEDFEMYYCGSQLVVNAWLKPLSRKSGWLEVDIGQSDDAFEAFPDDFKVAFVEFQRNKLYFSVDIRTSSELTEYSVNYAPDHVRKEWMKGEHCKYDYIKKQGSAMGIEPAKKEESYKMNPEDCDFRRD